MSCKFCEVAAKTRDSAIVFEDNVSLAFLDQRPLFPGHCLLIPREHLKTLSDLDDDLIARIFLNTQLLARAVEEAMDAEGTFIALNNKVSQSVPHLHIHIVPRNKKDGLRGFFWPRNPYRNAEHMEKVRQRLRNKILEICDDA